MPAGTDSTAAKGALTADASCDSLKDELVSGVSVDTSDLDEGWIFVGVPGIRRHGAALAKTAKQKGATVLVTDEHGAKLAEDTEIPVIVVENPRSAAGMLSREVYGTSTNNLLKVGITGTNGKTTSTYLFRAALSPLFGKFGLFGTLEIDVGSFSVQSKRTTHEAPVVHRAIAAAAEAGLSGTIVEVSSHAMSLDRVVGVNFDLVAFTNLQHDHLDFYNNSMDEYFSAKAQLFDPSIAKRGVVAVDDDYGRRLAREAKIPVAAVQVLSSDDPKIGSVPCWKVTNVRPDLTLGGSVFTLTDPKGLSTEAFCPIPGLVNVQNAALALVGATLLGSPLLDAINGLKNAPPVPGRMHWVPSDLETQPAVLVDYAHTPEAIEDLLRTMRHYTKGKLIAVFGTDGERDPSKREPLAEVIARDADVLWVTDESPRFEDAASIRAQLLRGVSRVRPDLADVTEVTTCRRDAIREAILAASPGDLVCLVGKGPETTQEFRGISHAFSDIDVATEVIRDTAGN